MRKKSGCQATKTPSRQVFPLSPDEHYHSITSGTLLRWLCVLWQFFPTTTSHAKLSASFLFLLQFLFSQVISIIILIKDVQFIIRGLQPPEVQWLRLLSFHCRRHRSRQGQNKTSSGSMLPLYSTMKSANPIKAQYICISHFLSAYYAPGPPWPPCFVCITFSDPGERSPFLNARKLPRTKRLGQTAGGMCTCTAYSPCCIVETNTTL